MTSNRANTILALCEQLRRTAALTIDDAGHVSDPDVLYYNIQRQIEALADELEGMERRWQDVLDDADGLTVAEGGAGTDLTAWLEMHGGGLFRGRLP